MKRAIILLAVMAASIANAQMFAQMFAQSSRLPAGYTELQYVVSTNATINTLWVAQPTSTIEIAMANLSSGFPYMWGYLVSGPLNVYFLQLRGGTQILSAWTGSQSTTTVNYGTGKHTWKQAAGVIYLDGASIAVNIPGGLSVSASLVLGTRIDNTAPNYSETGVLVARIYSLKMWTGTAPERNFIPVTDSAGVPALYDLVGKTTHYKVTGSLYAGPVK